MAKVKRYNEEGYVDTEFGDIEGAIERAKTAKPAAEPSFKDAFASARKAGDKTFEWNGKKFTTELAGEKKSTPSMKSPTESSGSGSYAPAPPKTTASKSADDEPKPKSASKSPKMYRTLSGEFRPVPEQTRQESMDNPLVRAFKAIRARGEAGAPAYAKGGKVKKMASGGVARSSASKRADGIATKGKTRGKIC